MSHETRSESLRFETFEAYLTWEEQQPIRYEFHDGYVVAMAGASETHNRIADNVALVFNQHYGLRGRCHAFRAEMKLRVGELKSRYPDIFVACEESGDRRFFDDARVVVEVISPDYARKDLVETPVECTRLKHVEQYIVIDSRKRAAWSHLRQNEGVSCSSRLRTGASRSRARTSPCASKTSTPEQRSIRVHRDASALHNVFSLKSNARLVALTFGTSS